LIVCKFLLAGGSLPRAFGGYRTQLTEQFTELSELTMKRLLVPARFLLLAASLLIPSGLAVADVPEALQQRQQQLFASLAKVRGAVVGVSDGFGVGSGVVVSRDGIVLTASHVVDSGNRQRGRRQSTVRITFPDGKEYTASVLGKNRDADAAILRINDSPPDQNGFPFAEMG